MKCSKMQKLMSPYVDDELPEEEKKALEVHLKGCKKCSAEMKEIQGLRQLFVDTENFEAPYGFHAKVMAKVDAPVHRKLLWVPIPVRIAEAITVLALIAVGIISGSLLVNGFSPERMGNELASLNLDVFNFAPPGTLGGAYLAMTEVRDEK